MIHYLLSRHYLVVESFEEISGYLKKQKGKKMSVYSISSINVKDWDAYAEYMKLVPAVIKKYGGKYLVRGGEIISDNTT